ncbi:succinyldiaminopimelate transaminase [Thioalkalivibrio paradoxus]|uniref:Succinyldiaminopimelate aminotransferase n=1 Tax=Thioalkalivibrio paradoxus ARh 1 TaxID=713585 RepID=W0DM73_9GAMM|nr:succinyldiaminopimelate transaminase [Thioalkalivibrio paradoxus]AHE98093.1 succinyldiaminopimelate aminotransferase [Thioalkalivibrio paradoxus ARh 1]
MNPNIERLQPYPFQRLRALFADLPAHTAPPPIALSIGEPRHAMPPFVAEVLGASMSGFNRYPTTRGELALREAISGWLQRRFGLARVDPDTQVVPVNGTREALFAFAQAVVDPRPGAAVLMPNPFYQIYEGAALLAGAEPLFYPLTADHGYRPDFAAIPDAVWDRVQLVYLCNPGNPAGAVIPEADLAELIRRAERHDFVIAADECYSEIYRPGDMPPPGLLGAAERLGNTAFSRCVVFHSLSKRSNLPGIRSGFVAGDAAVLQRFALYRTYHGCTMPAPLQAVSRAAWSDETHVATNRELYAQKFAAVVPLLAPVLEVSMPDAGFYLWPRVPGGDDEAFARQLQRDANVTVLPGRYLSRPGADGDPGAGHVRMALVAEPEACIEAAGRIRELLERT